MLLVALLYGTAVSAGAQEDTGTDREGQEAAGTAAVANLDAVRVLGQRPPPDPFAFRNPVQAQGTVFARHWDEPPSLEEIGMRGGIVQIGINKGLALAAQGIRTLPGWKDPIQHAAARPPPLDAAQQARAARFRASDADVPAP